MRMSRLLKLNRDSKLFGLLHCISMSLHYDGSISRKCRFFKYARLAQNKGVIWFRWKRLANDYVDAWYAMVEMPSGEKSWYIERGFNPRMKAFCGVLPDNYRRYISDFEFYNSKNYKNLSSSAWFDNKLNTYYLLSPFSEFIPKHYYYVEAGDIFPLDVSSKYNCTSKDVLHILKEEKTLAAKRCYGGHGEGFIKLENSDEQRLLVNGRELTEDGFCELIHSLRGYIITDFIKPAAWIRRMAGENAFGVLRVMTIYDKEDGPQFERVMMRIGTNKSGPTQAGHDFLYVGIDDVGTLHDCFYEYSDFQWEKMDSHPETGEAINGIIMPNMGILRELCLSISGYLPNTPYLIFDIIPTDNSFKILEINSHGQPFNFEPFAPVKDSFYFSKLFDVNVE